MADNYAGAASHDGSCSTSLRDTTQHARPESAASDFVRPGDWHDTLRRQSAQGGTLPPGPPVMRHHPNKPGD